MDLLSPPRPSPVSSHPMHVAAELPVTVPVTVLGVTDLACERGDRRLFAGLSFAVRKGEWIHVEGANGSGKTTLLRILCGLSQASAGEVLLDGRPVPEMRGSVRYLGHSPAVTGALTPLEHLEMDAALHPEASGDHEEILNRVGLDEMAETPCLRLSAGQQRRVALARLILAPGRLWILDEPLTALDRAGIQLVHDLLQKHLDAGGAAVITTHQPLGMPPDGKVLLEETRWAP